ncbi:MAG: hypothetical protein ACM319_02125 [Deltaproteobacteria bacterium]
MNRLGWFQRIHGNRKWIDLTDNVLLPADDREIDGKTAQLRNCK